MTRNSAVNMLRQQGKDSRAEIVCPKYDIPSVRR